jgi:tetratricopeptide (TPR) repeat protein
MVEESLEGARLSKLARRSTAGAETVQEKIDDLLSMMRERIRYTGVEFGHQAIVPSAPRETLDLGFGDCKDKATLLVGLLSELEIDADVVLLDTGPGLDVEPELPGLGWFDHAIVRVNTDEPIWIDPTHEHARAGELPDSDQNRWALVADPSTVELVRTPRDESAANRTTEKREFFLQKQGGARLVETTSWTGSTERTTRASFAAKSEAEAEERLQEYVDGAYGGGELIRFEFTDLDDLSTPLTLVLEAEEVKQGWTENNQSTVSVSIAGLLSGVPDELKPDTSEKEDADDENEEEARKNDLEWIRPHVQDWTYAVHPAPGYAAQSPPDDAEWRLGPASLTARYTVTEDGSVEARLVFDSGKATYSPADVQEFRDGLAELYKSRIPLIVFDQLGEAHLQAGSIREALAEFRKLVAEFPVDPMHRTQVARAMLAAGLGEVAREEAIKATELDPESADAFTVLGIILAHDELGRKFYPGFDRPGAERAFRKALELDPDSFEARGELAILLEHDAQGERWARDARLEEAVDEYRELHSRLDVDSLSTNLMVDLLRLRRFAELIRLADEAPRDASRDGLRIAAIAAERGAAEAVREASEIGAGAAGYRGMLDSAGEWLNTIREYDLAADIFAARAKGDPSAIARLSLADALRRTRRHETFDTSLATPESAVRSLFSLMTEDEAPEEVLDRLLDPLLDVTEEDRADLTLLLDQLAWTFRQQGVSADVVMDLIFSLARFSKDSDGADGYRMRLHLDSLPGMDQIALGFYLAASGNEYHISAMGNAIDLAGPRLQLWIDGGELERARRWLDWLHEETDFLVSDDPLSVHPLRMFWNRGDPADPERMRRAAATLPGSTTRVTEALATVDRLAAEAEGSESVAFDFARLYLATLAEDDETIVAAAARLIEVHPRSLTAFGSLVGGLISLQRWEKAEAAIAARLERFPGDVAAHELKSGVAMARDQNKESMVLMRGLIDGGKATAVSFNNLAWMEIVESEVSEQTLLHAQQAVAMDNYANPASLHTLATVYAELGRPSEARDVLLSVLESRAGPELESPDWYILGRIAEDYGVARAARVAYERVEPPEDSTGTTSSTYTIAQRRLEKLRTVESVDADSGGR